MKVRKAKAASPVRQRVEQPKIEAKPYTFPAPIRGLVQSENLAMIGQGTAAVLDNWICTETGIKVRGGSARYATISDNSPVVSMFRYRSGTNERIFGATDGYIFDLSAISDPITIPCLLYTSPSPRDRQKSRMPSSA